MLTETRITEDIEDNEINIKGYKVRRYSAESRNTGGVVIYVRDEIKIREVKSRKLPGNYWSITIWIKEEIYTGSITGIYHSPKAAEAEFVQFIEELGEELTIKEECIIMGDFNIDILVENYYSKKVKKVMEKIGMKQYIKDSTRITDKSKTLIDLVFANTEIDAKVKYTPAITDHAWIHIKMRREKKEDKRWRNYITREKNFLIEEFERQWNDNKQNQEGTMMSILTERKADQLVNNIIKILDNTAPKRNVKIPNKWYNNKWYTDEIKRETKQKDLAYKKAKQTQKEEDWERFK